MKKSIHQTSVEAPGSSARARRIAAKLSAAGATVISITRDGECDNPVIHFGRGGDYFYLSVNQRSLELTPTGVANYQKVSLQELLGKLRQKDTAGRHTAESYAAKFSSAKRPADQAKLTSVCFNDALLGRLLTVREIIDYICVGRSRAGIGSKHDPYRGLVGNKLMKAYQRDAELIFGWFTLNSANPKTMVKAYRAIVAIQDGPHKTLK